MHEHLDAFGIINMNGRVYDPQTAMFLSPDPFVQSPDNWANYNRNGYCMNNPLIYSDLSGYTTTPSTGGGGNSPVLSDMSFIKCENGNACGWDLQLRVFGRNVCSRYYQFLGRFFIGSQFYSFSKLSENKIRFTTPVILDMSIIKYEKGIVCWLG